MATPAQIEANRRNALKSTGPKTEEGKAASAINARKHGFRGNFFFAPAENPQEFWDLHASYVEDWQPATAYEEGLVQMLAENFWHRKRAQLLAGIYDQPSDLNRSQQVKEIGLQMKYMGQYERAFQRNLRSLQAVKKERQREEIGFDRQRDKLAAEIRHEQLHDHRVAIAKAKAEAAKLALEKSKLALNERITKVITAKASAAPTQQLVAPIETNQTGSDRPESTQCR